ncbi:cell division protein FtsA [Kordiimonas sediminis]|uniref:Cell division protein FtsA n=1 Tax=Kordiimonas sediminis TaxID=1735581 RepID=A0A919ASN9_9PROT|nr:cell division protein FtsA [Kordiimonas sediminis]GHF23174.1 cell division protein FtsA [Kordiimonas sediminis]
MSTANQGVIAALDVGGSKVACVIADLGPSGDLNIRGVGNRACRGVSGGVVTDMLETEKAIRASVEQAEKMAGETISTVILGFAGGEQQSTIIEVEVDVDGHSVAQSDIDRAIAKVEEQMDTGDREVLHSFTAAYSIDGAYSSIAPLGMYGKKLGLAQHVITINSSPRMNLEACVRRAHLDVSHVVSLPYASALSSLVEDEAKMGAACIDIGAGTTNIAIMAQGALVHADVIPIGGSQVTDQIARELLTPFEQAERLKTFSGAAIRVAADDRSDIEVPQVGEISGEESLVRKPRSALTGVIQNELEILFATIAKHLDASGFSGVSGKRVVLTGGVAQTEGIRDLAAEVLGRQVRLGRPQILVGLPQAGHSPAFAGAIGLLLYGAKTPSDSAREKKSPGRDSGSDSSNPILRVIGWLKDNF